MMNLNIIDFYRHNQQKGLYLLDNNNVPNAIYAHSTKRLKTIISGSYNIRIRRVSDDAEMDFTPEGDIATFISATTGRVRTLYDQTGNGFHGEQATDAMQGLIDTGDSEVDFTDTEIIDVDYSSGLTGDFSVFCSGLLNASAIDNSYYYLFGTDSLGIQKASGSNALHIIHGSTDYNTGSSLSVFAKLLLIRSGTDLLLYRDGTLVGSTTTTSYTLSNLVSYMVSQIDTTNRFKANILWDRALSTTERTKVFSSLTD